MKLVTFEVRTVLGPVRRIGALLSPDLTDDARIVDLTTGYGMLLREGGDARGHEVAAAALQPDMIAFLAGGEPARERARQVLEYARAARQPVGEGGRTFIFDRWDVRVLAPVPRPTSMRDYLTFEEHMTKGSRQTQKAPGWYYFPSAYKGNPDSVYGPEDPMLWPAYTDWLDPELELGTYIGREGRNIPVEQAAAYIGGYTIFVDCSARDAQAKESLGPFKGKDFCTMTGPVLVTPDEFDERNARCGIKVNGETWLETNLSAPRQYYSPELIAWTSDGETIRPGELFGSGTISFGCSIDMGKWVKPGDVVEHWVEGIGTMKATVVREENANSYVRNGLPGHLPTPDYAQGYLEKIEREGFDHPSFPFLKKG